MHLVELFLPLATNEGSPFTRPVFASVEKELTEMFGGATAYPRAPASGIWKENGESAKRDDLVVYEVMTERIEADWWKSYREKLEQIFKQERILIRSHEIYLL
jgi:hypothetical protein